MLATVGTNEGFVQRINDALRELIDSPENRQLLSSKMQQLVDGRGAERIANEIWNSIIYNNKKIFV